jgi:hypothetical protein
MQGDDVKLTAHSGTAKKILDDIKNTPDDNDPDLLFFFNWNHAHLAGAVLALNNANAPGVALPVWFVPGAASFPITAFQLQHAILNFVVSRSGTGGVVYSDAVIAPNTIAEFGCMTAHCGLLGLDPFWAVAGMGQVIPLANAHVVADGKRHTIATPAPVPVPPIGFGIIN